MSTRYGNFKYELGDVLEKPTGMFRIVERKYKPSQSYKNGVPYNQNQKWYKYHCETCGNEDWAIEYSIQLKDSNGCNVCCNPPRKIVKGINDITTTDNWLAKYFCDITEAESNSKYSNAVVSMRCPYCGRTQRRKISSVTANHNLHCICGDGYSYPNKFVYSLLNQLGLSFEIEKKLDWSNGKLYDDYIQHNGLKIITEQHGLQHYVDSQLFTGRLKSGMTEAQNDSYKKELALRHGIDYYFEFDCRRSSKEHIRDSICDSGFFEVLHLDVATIDWDRCDAEAMRNIAYDICNFKTSHPDLTIKDIAHAFGIAYATTLKYIQREASFGWCSYSKWEDRKILDANNRIDHGSKNILCLENGVTYKNAKEAGCALKLGDNVSRQIRKSIERKTKYKGYTFEFI